MDFSSVERALHSLLRRHPALSDGVLETAKALLEVYSSCPAENNNNNERNSSSSDTTTVTPLVLSLLQQNDSDDRWEPLAVGLYLATELMDGQMNDDDDEKEKKTKKIYVEGPRVPQVHTSTTSTTGTTTASSSSATSSTTPAVSHNNIFISETDQSALSAALLQACRDHLTHSEPRVRTLVAKAIGTLVRFVVVRSCSSQQQERSSSKEEDDDLSLWQPVLQLHDDIVQSLREHIASGRDDDSSSKENKNNYSRSSEGALDDTTGWRALETNWNALASLVAAMGAEYYQKVQQPQQEQQQELLRLCEHSCTRHVNRHVRAAGIATLEQWILAAAAANSSGTNTNHLRPNTPLFDTVVSVLTETLADNWSQVRMAASVLCRTFWNIMLSSFSNEETNDEQQEDWRRLVEPKLIPRMCLNRFYLAQGVKLYSHDTWRMIFSNQNNTNNSGKETVERCVGSVCKYYVNMCDADNHVVREAACQAVAELAVKLDAGVLAPYVPLLLQALLVCFHDESWPVRDEACLACGRFCRAFPEESRPELNTLLQKWTEQLTDPIWSVRQDAAVALGDAVVAYGDEVLNKCLEILRKNLPSAREQPAMTMEEYRERQNDVESHTNSQLYSCGSLAPKMRKGGAGRIGCSSCGVTRPPAPWEATDGCIYLLQELMAQRANDVGDDVWLPLVEELTDVCRVKHFPQGDDLRATLWRQLPLMARSLGKQRFKRQYLQLFVDLLMSNLQERTASALSKHAAGQCAEELAQLVGVGIFRGRLDDYQQEAFDVAMRERQQMPKGPVADGFSPFGPPDLLEGRPTAGFGGGAAAAPQQQQHGNSFETAPSRAVVPGSGFSDTL